MIQRIQTIFLLLAALVNLPMLFLKLADASSNATMESGSIAFYGMRFDVNHVDTMSMKFVHESLGFNGNAFLMAHAALIVLASVVLLAAIFLYKNRPLQIKVTYAGLVLVMAQMALSLKIFMDLPKMIEAVEGDPHDFGFWLFLPAAVILLAYLAARQIKKDEKLVQSMDRIR
jgi:Domain of unknown function (DUF4293)